VILVIDHFDSFVYNLVQLVGAHGQAVTVVRSDEHRADELAALRPAGVMLSPGPGRPEEAGCFLELVRMLDHRTPLLGVCLGHQAIGSAFGARIDRAPEPMHGKTSAVHHSGEGIFEGLPEPFEAGRYHSLIVDEVTLSRDVSVTARTADGIVMGLQHRSRPWFGVQFHPESILTPDGPRLVSNFLALARRATS
jgi:anthranilate synthase component II